MTGGFRHQAVLYGSADELASALEPSLRHALSRDETVFVVTTRANAEMMRATLGELARRLEWVDSSPWQRRLGARFDAADSFLADRSAEGRSTCILHDQAPGQELPWTLREYLRYEAVANVAFAGYRAPTPTLCLWDRRRFSPDALDAVCRTHPELIQDGRAVRSARFTEPASYLAEGDRTLRLPQPEMIEIRHPLSETSALAGLRQSLQEWARGWGLPPAASEDLVAAVHEVATNAVQHGSPPAETLAWREPAGLVCEVRDGGAGPRDPLSGYLRPGTDRARGWGLWLARRLADLVEVSTHGPGTRVRLHVGHHP